MFVISLYSSLYIDMNSLYKLFYGALYVIYFSVIIP